jgi:uncharacterized protein involved in outer membrane biogenesis
VFRRVLIGLLVLVAIAAGAIYWFFRGDGVRRALERQATAWLQQPVHIAAASVQLVPRVGIQLTDVRVGEPARLTLADVEVSTGLRALLSRRVEDAELILSDSHVDLPLPFVIPTASAEQTDAAASGGFTVASISHIALRDIHVTSRGREILISAESALVGDMLELRQFTARSGNTEIDVTGRVGLSPSIDARLKASAERLDLDELVALADAFTPEPSARRGDTATKTRLEAQLSAASVKAAGLDLSKFAATLVASGDRVTLTPAVFELFEGRYQGKFVVDLAERMSVSIDSRVTDLNVSQLAAFGGVPGSISGRMGGSASFTGRGRDFAEVLAGARGSGVWGIRTGTIRGLNLVRTVVLFFGRPAANAPESERDHFDRMDGSFELARQVVSTRSTRLESPDVDVTMSGTLTIPTKALDGQATLLLSEALTAQAGTDLVRFTREGNRVLLPATIGGTLEHPRVMIDAAAAVQRGLRNEMQRRLKGLFDRIKPPGGAP